MLGEFAIEAKLGTGVVDRVAKAQPMTPSCNTAPTPRILIATVKVRPTVCLVIGEAVSMGGVGTPE
jgi:hypothetical protein